MSGNSRARSVWQARTVMMAVDVVLINVAFVLAYAIRYDLELGGAVEEPAYLPMSGLFPLQIAITAVVMAALLIEGAYRQQRGVPWLDQLWLIARSTLVGLTIVLFAYLLFRPTLPSRLLFAYIWLLVVGLMGAARLVEGAIRSQLRRRGIGVARVLVVGAGQVGRAVM